MKKRPYCENCYAPLTERDDRYWCPICKDYRSPSPHSIEAAPVDGYTDHAVLDFPTGQQDQDLDTLPFFKGTWDGWDGVPPITLTEGDRELLEALQSARIAYENTQYVRDDACNRIYDAINTYKRITLRMGTWAEPSVPFVFVYDED